jgi:hypothetical protein
MAWSYSQTLVHLEIVVDRKENDRREKALELFGSDLQITPPAEINDAWNRLDLFTKENMHDLQSMRYFNPIIQRTACYILVPGHEADMKTLLYSCRKASDALTNLVLSLEQQIAELRQDPG